MKIRFGLAVALAAAFGIFGSAPARAQAPASGPRDVSAAWECDANWPEGSGVVPVPQGERVTVRYSPPSAVGAVGSVDPAGLSAWIAELESHASGVDWFDCVQKLATRLENAVAQTADAAHELGATPVARSTALAKLYSPLDTVTYKYGLRSKSARRRFVPMGAHPGYAYADNALDLLKIGYSDSMASFLDREFLAGKLPGVVSGADAASRERVALFYSDALARSAPDSGPTGGPQDAVAALSRAFGTPLASVLESISARGCSKMAPGEARIATVPFYGGYKILAGQGASFEIVLNVKFENDDRSPMPPAKSAPLVKLFQGCMAGFEPFLKGPNGESLKIRFPQAGDPGPAAPEVEVFEAVGREVAYAWDAAMPCGALLHETFHLLGLKDEYKELGLGYDTAPDGSLLLSGGGMTGLLTKDIALPQFDCRALGPRTSVMNNPTGDGALLAASPIYDWFECGCDPDEMKPAALRACRAKLALIKDDADECPAPTEDASLQRRGIDSDSMMRFRRDAKDLFDPEPFISGTKSQQLIRMQDRFIRVTANKPAQPSLLLPAQWRVITEPGCLTANAVYHACARNSQETSREHYGSGCWPAPAACSDGSFDWLK
jgi:hypothetical protein